MVDRDGFRRPLRSHHNGRNRSCESNRTEVAAALTGIGLGAQTRQRCSGQRRNRRRGLPPSTVMIMHLKAFQDVSSNHSPQTCSCEQISTGLGKLHIRAALVIPKPAAAQLPSTGAPQAAADATVVASLLDISSTATTPDAPKVSPALSNANSGRCRRRDRERFRSDDDLVSNHGRVIAVSDWAETATTLGAIPRVRVVGCASSER